jgi:cytochrome b
MTSEPDRRLVWDLPLRLFHWGIVICVAGAWATAEAGVQWFEWHVRCGYGVVILVSFRIAWGFVGPRHARFTSFVSGPRALLAYLRQLPTRAPAPSAGHSPPGALAVLAMLLLLAVQALTGLFANDTIFNNGPLYGYVSGALSDRLTSLHKANFDWLLVLIGLHLAAIAFYALWKRTNLVRPMVTGRKPADRLPPGAGIDNQRLWLAAVLVAIVSVVFWWVIETAPQASMSFF